MQLDKEMEAIRKNKTWHLKDLPVGRRVLKVKWVYEVTDELGQEWEQQD